MATMNVAVNVPAYARQPNHCEVLAWLNSTLQAGFAGLDHVYTGRSTCILLNAGITPRPTIMSQAVEVYILCILVWMLDSEPT